jgi:hypothetical protein
MNRVSGGTTVPFMRQWWREYNVSALPARSVFGGETIKKSFHYSKHLQPTPPRRALGFAVYGLSY